MNPSAANPNQGSIKAQLAENLVQNTQVSFNLGGGIITITEDKIKLAVHEHLSRMRLKYEWVAPAGILITIVVAFVTADFKNIWLPPATWEAIFILVGLVSAVWLVRAIVRAVRAPSVEDFVGLLRASQVPLSREKGDMLLFPRIRGTQD